jgi:transposase-like protein
VPRPLPPDKRAAIVRDITTGGKSAGRIARDHGVAQSTVSRIAKQDGLDFDRSQTKRATEAAVADNKARRAVISRKFLEKADELLDQMDQPHLVFNFGGKDNTYNERELDRPPTADLRNLIVSAATAFDKHLAADRHDSDDQGLAAVDAWLRTMLGS